ncbi:hypothetical protein [Micropruina sp.]|nr:hypothetical protein [Micropruina sp.]
MLTLTLLLPVTAQPLASQPSATLVQESPRSFCTTLPWFCPWRV